MRPNPIELQVFKNLFSSICEEMGKVLERTSFSPNIKERRDFSCAIFNERGEMVSQASHIPVHLGSMSQCVKAVIQKLHLKDGDVAITNDPFLGGTHLPDITAVSPVVIDGKVVFYVASRAHHADIGGMSPGSLPVSTSIYQEGLIIPPVKLIDGGKINQDILELILANVRTREEREGDIASQINANRKGIERLKETMERHGTSKTLDYANHLMDYAELLARSIIKAIPDGTYKFQDVMDDDGMGAENIPIKLKLTSRRDSLILDFSETSQQVKGPINAVRSITLSCVLYVMRCLLPEDTPTNDGLMRPVDVVTRPGTLVDATRPAAVSAGNVETSQRIVDVILGALSKALPNMIPSASQGTMNNLLIGDERGSFVYYETIGGGMGAGPTWNGESAIHSHMTNTMNTPIEALEMSYPLVVREYSIRKGSGGKGKTRGGNGIIREIEARTLCRLTVISERRKNPPYSMGGEPGLPGKNIVIRSDGSFKEMPGKFSTELAPGDRIRIETPGGGGFGRS